MYDDNKPFTEQILICEERWLVAYFDLYFLLKFIDINQPDKFQNNSLKWH